MSNFGYLRNKAKYQSFAEELIQAEELYGYNTKICVRQCRAALEAVVKWVYAKEGLSADDMMLGALVHDYRFKRLVPEDVWNLLPDFVKTGNTAVHTQNENDQVDAISAMKVLFTFVQWIEENYNFVYKARTFDINKIGTPDEEEVVGETKLFICNRTLLKRNSGNNIQETSRSYPICTEKLLNQAGKDYQLYGISSQYNDVKSNAWLEDTAEDLPTDNITTVPVVQEEEPEEETPSADYGLKTPEEYFAMAEKFYYGQDVEKSYKKAFECYFIAAEQGHAEAQNKLAMCYYYGDGITKSYSEAVKWYTKAAEQGHADAQYNLGFYYYYGDGVEQSYEEAVEWYTKAAKQGDVFAQYYLANCYYEGKGVKQSYEEAVKWYTKAAEHGATFAKVKCEQVLAEEEIKKLFLLAKQGDAESQNKLGEYYYYINGLAQSYEKALEWFTKAAEQGHARGQYNLGLCYYYGKGIAQSYEKALEWFTKAAEQGDKNAIEYKEKCEEELGISKKEKSFWSSLFNS